MLSALLTQKDTGPALGSVAWKKQNERKGEGKECDMQQGDQGEMQHKGL